MKPVKIRNRIDGASYPPAPGKPSTSTAAPWYAAWQTRRANRAAWRRVWEMEGTRPVVSKEHMAEVMYAEVWDSAHSWSDASDAAKEACRDSVDRLLAAGGVLSTKDAATDYMHDVSTVQHWLGRAADLLRLDSDSPRSLCGVSLVDREATEPDNRDLPACPRCRLMTKSAP